MTSQSTILGSQLGLSCRSRITHELSIRSFLQYLHLGRERVRTSVIKLNSAAKSSTNLRLKDFIFFFLKTFCGSLKRSESFLAVNFVISLRKTVFLIFEVPSPFLRLFDCKSVRACSSSTCSSRFRSSLLTHSHWHHNLDGVQPALWCTTWFLREESSPFISSALLTGAYISYLKATIPDIRAVNKTERWGIAANSRTIASCASSTVVQT